MKSIKFNSLFMKTFFQIFQLASLSGSFFYMALLHYQLSEKNVLLNQLETKIHVLAHKLIVLEDSSIQITEKLAKVESNENVQLVAILTSSILTIAGLIFIFKLSAPAGIGLCLSYCYENSEKIRIYLSGNQTIKFKSLLDINSEVSISNQNLRKDLLSQFELIEHKIQSLHAQENLVIAHSFYFN